MFEKIPGLIMKSETVGHIGKIENVNAKELRKVLGTGDVTVTVSIE